MFCHTLKQHHISPTAFNAEESPDKSVVSPFHYLLARKERTGAIRKKNVKTQKTEGMPETSVVP